VQIQNVVVIYPKRFIKVPKRCVIYPISIVNVRKLFVINQKAIFNVIYRILDKLMAKGKCIFESDLKTNLFKLCDVLCWQLFFVPQKILLQI